MKDPEYFAAWWNEDLFTLTASNRSSGNYSFQMCEVEIIVDSTDIVEALEYDM